MKKTLLFIIALVLTIGQSFAQTVATLPFYEGFDYTAGADYAAGVKLTPTGTLADVTTANGLWVYGATVASSDPVLVPSPWTSSKGLPAVTGNAIEFKGGSDDPVIKIPTQPDNSTAGSAEATIYASFLVTINDWALVVSNTSADYFFSFAKGTFPGTSFNYASNVYYKRNGTNNNFTLGIAETNSTTKASFGTTEFSLGDQILIVIAYKYTDTEGTSYMWINPTVSATEPASTLNTLTSDETNVTASFTSIRHVLDKVRINKNGNSTTPDITLDEIRVANTWAEVVGQSTASLNELANSVSIFPNPAKDFIFIQSPTVEVSKVELFNSIGQMVLSQDGLVNNGINVSNLSKGIYVMKLNSANSSYATKIVVE